MPLSRYEIRSEYSLANPDLYRAADKDDPEGLLEGVAMAGLVGIIRQLGDLAEFAAEVFHDLHEDILATAARSHELLVRVQQLEREVPLIEDLMLIKTDCRNFMYNPGVEWHVHIHNEQNHFTQGDLPRFIRSAYEECRSPPRLFALDRFDATGAGTCLKRFTDPSFFKMDWARSELMKAEREQRDHKARRLKRKGRRQENGEVREARITSHGKLRTPIETENAATSSIPSSSSNSSIRFEQDILDSLKQENEDMLTANSSLFSGQEGPQLKGIDVESARVEELPLELSRQELSYLDTGKDVGRLNEGLESDLKEGEVMADESASETDNFMDAVTTMDSEVETDTETKAKVEEEVDVLVNIAENEAPGSQAAYECPRETGEQHVLVEDNVEHNIGGEVKDATVVADNFSSGDLTPEDLNAAEQSILVDGTSAAISMAEHDTVVDAALKALPEVEELPSVNGDYVTCPPQHIDALTLDSPSGMSSVEEDDVAMSEGLSIDNASRDIAEEENSAYLVKSRRASSSDSNGVSSSANRSGASSPVLEEEVLSSSNRVSTERVVTSETLEANNTIESLGHGPSAHASQLEEESGVAESQNQAPPVSGTRKRWQINNVLDNVFLAPVLGIDGSQASESEQGESPKKPSSHSSPSSSIQPMRWAVGSTKSYHTDDEIDGLQGSLGSLSTTSSNLSSPRPLMLTTTLQSFSLGGKQESSPLPQKSADSSPPSPTCSTPKSSISTTVYEQASLAKSSLDVVASLASEHSAQSSPDSSSSAVQPFFDSLPSLGLNFNASAPENMAESLSSQNVGVDNLENFPPPPPLPPLAWRMTRRSQRAAVCSPILMDPPMPTLGQSDAEMLANEPSTVSTASMPAPAISHPTGVRHMPDNSMQSLTHEKCPSENTALHAGSEEVPKASKPAESESTCSHSSTSDAGASQEELVSVSPPTTFERENVVTAIPDTSLHEKLLNRKDHALLARILRTESTPAKLDETRAESEGKTARGYGVARQDFPANFERTEISAEASTSYDMNRLKRRSKWALTSSTASSDDREVLLHQIRTRSFSLRTASGEKRVVPRPVTNINVAAILEKASAIRQAFAGSDDDDEEWSDT